MGTLSNTFTLSICPLACKPRHISGVDQVTAGKCLCSGRLYIHVPYFMMPTKVKFLDDLHDLEG